MDRRYEAYCFADPLFFDEQRSKPDSKDGYTQGLPQLPTGWQQGEQNGWQTLLPDQVSLPNQGWKIHVSATIDNAENVLGIVHKYCVRQHIAFKYLISKSVMIARNSKYAGRGNSGKLITIYPANNEQLEQILTDLSALLAGEPGPYILTDLRFGEGPLYVRYGAFAEQWVEANGVRVLAMQKPDGTLVPDERQPKFVVPEWETLPEFLAPHLAARKGGDPSQMPYRVVAPMHFSNGGGVYEARRVSDGHNVVLKEARPHAGLDATGADAVTRLRHEYDILNRLAGVSGVPQVYELITVWEHHFMAMQHLPGRPLSSWLSEHYPLTKGDVSDEAIQAYRRRALELVGKVEALVSKIHQRGIVFADLHPMNILVHPESTEGKPGSDLGPDPISDSVSLVDFELAELIDEPSSAKLGAPGFRARDDRQGVDIDLYSLAALKLWIFLPLNSLLDLAPDRLSAHITFIEQRFALPPSYGEQLRAVLTPRGHTPSSISSAALELDRRTPDWNVVRKSIATAILGSATPQRQDRLFPGDIEQFELGGACFAVGAAGVLHALHEAGAGRYPEYEEWLLDSVRRTPPTRPGFYDGAHGIAYVLENFGHHDAATRLLTESENLVRQTTEHSVNNGLAGIALNYLHFAELRGDREYRAQAFGIGDRLADKLAKDTEPGRKARAGLLSGWSGPALLFTRLYERTNDSAWLTLADQAVGRDLAEAVVAKDGSLQIDDGRVRTLPYLGIGSAGVIMALENLATYLPDSAHLEKLPGLRQACQSEFVIYPGLVFGRAGLIAALAMERNRDAAANQVIARHFSAFGPHAVRFKDGIAFPGNELLRLSMDLQTGGAGILLALSAVLDGTPVLPFVDACHPQSPGQS